MKKILLKIKKMKKFREIFEKLLNVFKILKLLNVFESLEILKLLNDQQVSRSKKMAKVRQRLELLFMI